jgi:hypothetical protein
VRGGRGPVVSTRTRAVIREGGVWADTAPTGDDLWAQSFTGDLTDLAPDMQWMTAIDVVDTIGGEEEAADTVYVPAGEEWDAEVYRAALAEAGWITVGDWVDNSSIAVDSGSATGTECGRGRRRRPGRRGLGRWRR